MPWSQYTALGSRYVVESAISDFVLILLQIKDTDMKEDPLTSWLIKEHDTFSGWIGTRQRMLLDVGLIFDNRRRRAFLGHGSEECRRLLLGYHSQR